MSARHRDPYAIHPCALFVFDANHSNADWIRIALVGARSVDLDGDRACAVSDFEIAMGGYILQHMVFNSG